MVDIIDEVLTENGGTIAKTGRTVQFKSGYQVSVKDGAILPVEQLTPELLESELTKLGRTKDRLGLWIDSGKVFVDISNRISTKREAMELGRTLNQQSIFDWRNKKLIWLND